MKIKVLVFGLTDNFGGIESFFINHVSHNKSDIIFDFVLSNQTSYDILLKEKGSTIHYLKTSRRKNPIKYYSELKKIIKLENYDYVWQNIMSRSNLVPVTIASKKKIKTILHIHGSGHVETGLISRSLDRLNKRRMYKYTNLYLTCSEKASKFFFEEKSKEAIFIPNAINIEKYTFDETARKKIRDELTIDKDTFILGNVARLTPVKNLFFLIDIFKNINIFIKNSALIIVGDGKLMSELKLYAKKLKLENNVIFLGSRDDINDILSSMDAYVMPSITEGLPISLVEAQVARLNSYVSDSITREVEVSDNIKFISLDKNALEWANIIIEDYLQNIISKRDNLIREKIEIFDVRKNIKMIQKILVENYNKK